MEDQTYRLNPITRITRRSVLLGNSDNVVIGITHIDESGSIDISNWGLATSILLSNNVSSESIGTFSSYIATIILNSFN